MGGRGRNRSRTQRKHFKDNRENVWKRPKSDTSLGPNNPTTDNPAWQPFSVQNVAFDEYYKEQGIVAPEEWDVFLEILRKPLPAAFRINSSSQFCYDIRAQLENDFMKSLQAEAVEGGEVEAIKPLLWYPEKFAWHSNFSRMQIRKNQTLERFHEFLKLENEIGNITRQEAVSMVPPLFLDVRPEHFVLDMCAAPGSKTFQLLEIIYQSVKPGSLPAGMVVANDPAVQRCNLLIHQTKRMCTANLIVTNHDGQQFPGCRSNKSFPSGCEKTVELQSSINQLLFDRVLCDVPCSGDGTLRKAPDMWRKWNSGMGNGLHSLQVLIAMRGLALLKVGGRMVYSTCSMNPVEDEAAVAEILRRCGGSVELVDVSGEFPELVRRPGLKKWKVRDRGVWLASCKDVPKFRRSVILPSMFPSGRSFDDQSNVNQKHENDDNVNSEDGSKPMDVPVAPCDDLMEEISDFPLEYCMRILPHDQNTGAFFIAVLRKLSSLPVPEIGKQGKLYSPNNEPPENLSNQAFGNSKLEVDSEAVPDNKFSEAVSDNKFSEADAIEDNELEVDSEDVPDDKFSEVASEANATDDKPEEASLEPDQGNECEERVLEHPQAPISTEIDSGIAGVKRKKQMQGKWKGVDPVVFFRDDKIINSINTFYGIDESFPLKGHLITRSSDTNHVKRIYYISKSVKEVLELNLQAGQQLKISSVGLKMFERQTSREGTSAPCSFRISSEGLPVILPYITKQILYASAVDFKHLLQYKTIKFADFVDALFGEKAANLMMGCCVIVLRQGKVGSDPVVVDSSTIAIGCWKGRSSLSVMVTAIDCQELLERLVKRMETAEGGKDELQDSHITGSNGKAESAAD